MNNRLFIFLGLLGILLVQCTPKTGEVLTKEEKPVDFRAVAPPAGPAPKIQIGDYEQFELANGLKVIVVENHKIPRISLQLTIDLPLIQEGDYAGYQDLAGQLLNKGTTKRTKAEIDEAVDFMGASLSSGANGLYAASLTKHFPDLLEIATDVLLHPTFPEAEFEKIKTQTLSGLAQAKEDPNTIASNVAQVLRYGKDHPYGEIVTEESIEKVTVAKCRDYYETYFQPDISYLVIVGDITSEAAKQMAEQYFGPWKKTKELRKDTYPTPAAPIGTKVDFVNKSGAVQSVIAITYPVELLPGSPDVIKSRVMNTMLGSFFQSRLNQNLRETHGYTYGAGSTLSSDREVGYFSAGASVRNEVTDSSLVEFLYELRRIREELISPEELELAKNVIAGGFARSLERPQTIANFALNTVRYNLPADYYANYLEVLSQVTREEVKEMAQKYLRPDRAHILVVGNRDEVSEKLVPFSPSGIIDYYDATGNKMELTFQEIPEGYTAQKVLERYISVVGGKEKIFAIKSTSSTMTTEMQGMKVKVEAMQQMPNGYALFVSVNGTVVQSEIYNGQQAKTTGMAGEKMLEGEALKEMKEKVFPVPEMFYEDLDYTTTLQGIEDVDGQPAYSVLVQKPSGNKSLDYFSIDSGLKIRSIITNLENGQSVTQSADYQEYTEMEGFLFSKVIVVTGGGNPMPMKMELQTLEINKPISGAVFKID